jgi:aminoglycoside phosphotransferase (APT) family kinase protein
VDDVADAAMTAPVDADALRRWLVANVDSLADGPMAIDVLAGGASNLTMAVRIGDREVVVRRPPVGHFLPTAHDMAREHRFISALRDTPVPVAKAYALCEDADVIGAPFYVMERLHGIVPHEPEPLAHLSAAQGRALSDRFVDVLVAIHGVDLASVGLDTVAKPTGYLERQVARWTDQWERSKAADAPVIDELAARLRRALPVSPPTAIVHGDYRLGNVMVDAHDPTRIVGVFDWEMATIGDPLADLGYTLLYWGTADRPPIHPSQRVADLPGFLTADGITERYAATTGLDVDGIAFYVVLAAFKLTIIGEGIRARARQTGADTSGHAGVPLADWALDLATRSGLPGLR